MKRMALFILALTMAGALCAGASAQAYCTLPEIKAQTAQGWHETYADRYGRTISVDADIQVFGEERVPVLRTRFADNKLNPGLIEADAYWSDGKEGVNLYRNNPAEEIFKSVRGEKAMILHRSYGEKIDMDAVYMEEYGASVTMREMTETLTGILAKHGIDASGFLFDQPKEFSVRCRVKRDTMQAATPAAYFAHFYQNMYGFPILAHVNDGYQRNDGPTCAPQLVLLMKDAESYSIHMDTLEEMDMLAQDVPLCSFETVKREIEKEIEAGHVRKVFGVRLGYVAWNDPENPEGTRAVYDAKSFYLVPMWVIDCIYMDNAKKEYVVRAAHDDELSVSEGASAEWKRLIVDAQTGEMLNPNATAAISASRNSDYKGFVSWDDVK